MDEHVHPDDELLIRYLDGEMDPLERSIVDGRLMREPEFAARLEALRASVLAVQQWGAREEVGQVHRDMMKERAHNPPARLVRMPWVRRVAIAAAVLLVVFAGLRYYGVGQKTAEKLYASAFVDYQVATQRGDSAPSRISAAYGSEKFTEVIALASTAERLTSEDSLLTGLAYLKTDKAPRAAFWFSSLLQSPVHRQDAQFYLALTQLRDRRYDESLRHLQAIRARPDHLYRAQVSEELIREIEALK